MFNEKKVTQPKETGRNIIGVKTKIVGNIESEGDFRIDGLIEGEVKTNGRVIIGKTGVVRGTVICAFADVEGTIEGVLSVSETLTLYSTASVSGETTMGKLSVEPGANLNGTCTMKGAVKELKKKRIEKTA
jgi:cytoskeletal protein CcmA (bactofilin family)